MLRKRLNQFILCAGNSGNTVGKELGMRISDVGDHSPLRRSNAGQGGDLSGAGHTHLDDCNLMFRLELQ